MKKIFKTIFSLFSKKGEIKEQKQEKEEIKNELKEIKEILPTDFLNYVLNNIIYSKGAFPYEKDGWKVTGSYFVGATLCLDVVHEDIQETITISTDNSFGFFVNRPNVKRSRLSSEGIYKLNIIRQQYGKRAIK